VNRRPLRDELRDLFDHVSEPAHPALAARIRAEIAGRGGQAPGRAPRLAVAVAVVAAIAVVTSLVLAGRHGVQLSPSPGTQAHPAPVASVPAETPTPALPSPAVSATPAPAATGTPAGATTPAPNAAAPPGFTCEIQTGGGTAGGTVTAVRTGQQSGYDRFVIELAGGVGQYQVKPQGNATFTQDASGQQVTLAGSAGLAVTLHDTSSHGTYTGPTDLQPAGTANLREARQLGDFEGVVTWGLGLAHPGCFRAFTLSGPSRLVVDVQA
jgi:hypothetical protein